MILSCSERLTKRHFRSGTNGGFLLRMISLAGERSPGQPIPMPQSLHGYGQTPEYWQMGRLAATPVGVNPIGFAALMPLIPACTLLAPTAATSPSVSAACAAGLKVFSLDDTTRTPSLVSVTALVMERCVRALMLPAIAVVLSAAEARSDNQRFECLSKQFRLPAVELVDCGLLDQRAAQRQAQCIVVDQPQGGFHILIVRFGNQPIG